MRRRNLIKVTEEDIAKSNGRYGSCKLCPIAYALHRAGYKGFRVWFDGIDFGRKANRYLKFPRSINLWQQRQLSTPFEFKLSDLKRADRSKETV